MKPFDPAKRRAVTAALALALVQTLPGHACASPPPAAPRVQLPQGEIEGEHAHAGPVQLRVFRGIPYAGAPVGAYRWHAPQPVARWAGVRDATRFAPRCMQLPRYQSTFRSSGMSEDCLYLNVWTPAASEREKRPVLVYFHGGGFDAGDGSEPRYDGAHLASRGVVTVTVNYRLGVFGFLAHPDAAGESASGAAGNYGLLDQLAALRWVRDNIARFGGDPGRVTIGGAAAGAISVSAHMASPLSRGLFARAFGESGGAFMPTKLWSRSEAEQAALQYAEAMQAGSLQALREISAERLLEATGPADKPAFPFWPHIDGSFLTGTPESVFRSGAQTKVPLLLGTNEQEQSFRLVVDSPSPSPEDWLTTLRVLFGEHADEALTHYPGTNTGEVIRSGTELANDLFVGHSTWRWMELHRMTGGSAVYFYRYVHPRPADQAAGDTTGRTTAPAGAAHGAEIEYMLGNLALVGGNWQPADHDVSKTFSGYLERFVKSGDPNREHSNFSAQSADDDRPASAALPSWPAVDDRQNGVPTQTIGTQTATDRANLAARHSFMQRFFAERLEE